VNLYPRGYSYHKQLRSSALVVGKQPKGCVAPSCVLPITSSFGCPCLSKASSAFDWVGRRIHLVRCVLCSVCPCYGKPARTTSRLALEIVFKGPPLCGHSDWGFSLEAAASWRTSVLNSSLHYACHDGDVALRCSAGSSGHHKVSRRDCCSSTGCPPE